MTNQIDYIVKHLFSKKNLDEVSEHELEDFVDMHPYFAAGHFLLAKKLQRTRPDQVQETVATTALYYNNALWLQWLLDQDITRKKQPEKPTVANNHEEVVTEEEQGAVLSVNSQDQIAEEPSAAYDVQDDPIDGNTQSPSADQPKATAGWTNGTEDPYNAPDRGQLHEEDAPRIPEEKTFSNHKNEQPDDTYLAVTPIEAIEEEQALPAIEEPVVLPDTNQTEKAPQTDDQVNHDAASGQLLGAELIPGDDKPVAAPPVEHESKSASIGREASEDAETRATAASIGKTLASAALIPTKAGLEKNDFTFEPYHTIDYFASQGIKLQQGDLSKDKFGKQLKSFTEWLRSMKRLPQASIETNMDEATQRTIQKVAEHSIEEKEIVTETMAEVWIKQGNTEKAIDTLHKLSLLNPSKSHYFAARIEQLKAL
jgi:hypothetical protein